MVVTDLAISSYAGNKRTIHFTVRDQDTAGSPLKDLTGISARFAASKFGASGDFSTTPTLTKDSANSGEIVIDADQTGHRGELDVFILEGDTSAMHGDFYFELELYVPATFSNVVATGTWSILRNVVNP